MQHAMRIYYTNIFSHDATASCGSEPPHYPEFTITLKTRRTR